MNLQLVMRVVKSTTAAALIAMPLFAQSFSVAGRSVQAHGFASQGFAYSDKNNYLTMKTSEGSFAFTAAGPNVPSKLTDKFGIGAQVFTRNVGNPGQWRPALDWAFRDYKFTDWFGIRGGTVKTTLGLHTDTQDMEFLHTFALLPQSIYPLDFRDATIAHMGGDIYGGYIYLLKGVGLDFSDYGALQYGADVRWNTPLKGLLVGASHMKQDITGNGTSTFAFPGGPPPVATPYWERSNKDYAKQFFGPYVAGNLRVDAEYRRWWRDQLIFNGMTSITTDNPNGFYAVDNPAGLKPKTNAPIVRTGFTSRQFG